MAQALKSESGCALVRKLCRLGPSELGPSGRGQGKVGMGEGGREVEEPGRQPGRAGVPESRVETLKVPCEVLSLQIPEKSIHV